MRAGDHIPKKLIEIFVAECCNLFPEFLEEQESMRTLFGVLRWPDSGATSCCPDVLARLKERLYPFMARFYYGVQDGDGSCGSLRLSIEWFDATQEVRYQFVNVFSLLASEEERIALYMPGVRFEKPGGRCTFERKEFESGVKTFKAYPQLQCEVARALAEFKFSERYASLEYIRQNVLLALCT